MTAEREEEEELSKAGMPVNRRPKPKKAPARPKSQHVPAPVYAVGEGDKTESSPSHSSQEDIHSRGRSSQALASYDIVDKEAG